MIRFLTVLLLWCGLALPGFAQSYPQLHHVTGVTAGDVLNIRQSPNATAPIVGQLTPEQQNIEVVGIDDSGKWGQVNTGETSGWVAMRFMQQAASTGDYIFAQELHCAGTEPFWSLDVVQSKSATLTTQMGADTQSMPARKLVAGTGRSDRYMLGLGTSAIAIISQEYCSDGMSDQAFGLAIDLVAGGREVTLYSGCCSIKPN